MSTKMSRHGEPRNIAAKSSPPSKTKVTLIQKKKSISLKKDTLTAGFHTNQETEDRIERINDTKKRHQLKRLPYDTSSESHSRYLRAREKAFEVGLNSRCFNSYDPLVDEFLQDYFSAPSIRRHLRRLGIINKYGEIIDERSFKYRQLELERRKKQKQFILDLHRREIDREVEVSIRHSQTKINKCLKMRLKNETGDASSMLQRSYTGGVSKQGATSKRKKSSGRLNTSFRSNSSSHSPSKYLRSLKMKEMSEKPHYSADTVSTPKYVRASTTTISNINKKRSRFLEKAQQTSASLINAFDQTLLKKSKIKTLKKESRKVDSSVGPSQEFSSFEFKATPIAIQQVRANLTKLKSHLKDKNFTLLFELKNETLEEFQKYSLKEIEMSNLKNLLAETHLVFAKAHFELKSFDECDISLFWALHYGKGEETLVQEITELKLQTSAQKGIQTSLSLENDPEDAKKVLLECVEKLGINYLSEMFPQLRISNNVPMVNDFKPTMKNSVKKRKEETEENSKPAISSTQKKKVRKADISDPSKASSRDTKTSNVSKPLKKSIESIKLKHKDTKVKQKSDFLSKSLPSQPLKKIIHKNTITTTGKLYSSLNISSSKKSSSVVQQKKRAPLSLPPKQKESSKPVTPQNDTTLTGSDTEVESPTVYHDATSSFNASQNSTKSPLSVSKLTSSSLLRLAMFKFLPISSNSLNATQTSMSTTKATSAEDRNISASQNKDTNSLKSTWIDEKLPLPNSNFTLHQENEKKEKIPLQKRLLNLLQNKVEEKSDDQENKIQSEKLEVKVDVLKEEENEGENDGENDIRDMPLLINTSSNSSAFAESGKAFSRSGSLSIPTSIKRAPNVT